MFQQCYKTISRLEISSSLMDSLKRGLSLQSGGLDILLCLIGTLATLVSVLCDEWFEAPMKQQEKIQVSLSLIFQNAQNFHLTFKIGEEFSYS